MFYITLLFHQIIFLCLFLFIFECTLSCIFKEFSFFSSLYCREIRALRLILTHVLKLLFIQWIHCTDLVFQMFWVNPGSNGFLLFHALNSNVKFVRDCRLMWKFQRRTFTLMFLLSSLQQYNIISITILCTFRNMISRDGVSIRGCT